MKRISILLAIFTLAITSASAQFHKTAGMSINYGSYVENLGIGLRYQHEFTKHIRVSPSFTYYFNANNKSGWDINLDAHYLIPLLSEQTHIYPLIGGTLVSVAYKDRSYSKNQFGGNFGGGIQHALSERFGIFGEVKYAVLNGTDQFGVGIGMGYKF